MKEKMSNIILTGRKYLLYYGVIQPEGALAGAPAAGGNACRIRLRSPRPAFFSLSNRSVVLNKVSNSHVSRAGLVYSSPSLHLLPGLLRRGIPNVSARRRRARKRPLRLACTGIECSIYSVILSGKPARGVRA